MGCGYIPSGLHKNHGRKVDGSESTQNQWLAERIGVEKKQVAFFLTWDAHHKVSCFLGFGHDHLTNPRHLLLGLAGILLGITSNSTTGGAHTLFNVGVGLTVVGVALWVIQLVRGQGR